MHNGQQQNIIISPSHIDKPEPSQSEHSQNKHIVYNQKHLKNGHLETIISGVQGKYFNNQQAVEQETEQTPVQEATEIISKENNSSGKKTSQNINNRSISVNLRTPARSNTNQASAADPSSRRDFRIKKSSLAPPSSTRAGKVPSIFDRSVNTKTIDYGGVARQKRASSIARNPLSPTSTHTGKQSKAGDYLRKQGRSIATNYINNISYDMDLSKSLKDQRKGNYSMVEYQSVEPKKVYQSRVPNTASVERMIEENIMLKANVLNAIEDMHYKVEKQISKRKAFLDKNIENYQLK